MSHTPGSSTSWLRHHSSRLLLILGGCISLHWLWLLSGWATDETRFVSNLVYLPPGLIAAALAWHAGTHPILPPRSRLAWRLIGLAYLADGLGNVLWMVIEHGLGLQPFPSWADALYLIYYPLLLAGVLLLSTPTGQRRSAAFWLDAAIVLAGGGMVVWHLVIGPTARLGADNWLEAALSLAYPTGSLILLFALATVTLNVTQVLDRRMCVPLLAALGSSLVADLLYGVLSLAGTYNSGHWIDGLWTLSSGLVALAAQRAGLLSTSQAKHGPTPKMSPVPYISAAIGYGLLIAVAVAAWGSPLAELALGAAALATLGAIRLFLTRRENLRLHVAHAERAAEARFRAMVEHAADIILLLDTGGTHRYASPAALRVLGYTPELLPPLGALVAPEQQAALEQQYAELLHTPDGLATGEFGLRHADGSWRTCSITWRNLLHTPHVGGVVAVCRDITERAAAEAALRVSEESLRTIIDTAPVGISTIGAGGYFQLANPALCALLGFTQEELDRKTVAEVTHPEDYARELEAIHELLDGRASSYAVEKRFVRSDGEMVWVTLTGSLILDSQGRRTAGLGIALDITARRAAEAELRRTKALLQGLVDHAPLRIALRDQADGRYLLVNQLYASGLGGSADDLVGRCYTDAVTPAAAARWQAEDAQMLASGLPLQVEETEGDGAAASTLLITKFPVLDPAGSVTAIGVIAKDITERKRAEQELRESHAFLQSTLDALSAHIAILDADGVVLATNVAWREFGALSGGRDTVGACYLPLCGGLGAAQAAAAAAGIQAVRDGRQASFALEYRCPNSEEARWFLLRVTRFPWHATIRLVVAHEEITARKLAEEAVQASEARLRTLVRHIPGAVVLLFDHELRYLVADGQGLATIGFSRETVEGHTLLELVPEVDADKMVALYQATLAGTPSELDLTIGEVIYRIRLVPVRDGGGGVIAGILLGMDITQLRRDEAERLALQQRLLETQRLESVGMLAGGIAHDFNNLLTAVLGHAELLLMDLPQGSPLLTSVQAIIGGSQRAAELTGQLLAYAGKGRFLIQPVALNTLIRELAELTRTTVHHQAHLRLQLDASLPVVEADATQLRQVVLNLLLNASDALDEQGGTILIETAAEELDEATVRGLLLGEELPAGRYVRLSVCDTGHGMDAATQARMFEPFFSTKFTGRGLGLASVHGIVRGHRGAIQVTSAPGQGTVMRIWLPALAEAVSKPASQDSTAKARQETVLIIDDEASVRTITRRMLERMGYQVIEAAGGAAGLTVLAAHPSGLWGVLLDLTMPELGGDVVARHIARDHPGTRVLLMSGYNAEEIRQRYDNLPISGFLQKPFSFDALRSALGAPHGGSAL